MTHDDLKSVIEFTNKAQSLAGDITLLKERVACLESNTKLSIVIEMARAGDVYLDPRPDTLKAICDLLRADYAAQLEAAESNFAAIPGRAVA